MPQRWTGVYAYCGRQWWAPDCTYQWCIIEFILQCQHVIRKNTQTWHWATLPAVVVLWLVVTSELYSLIISQPPHPHEQKHVMLIDSFDHWFVWSTSVQDVFWYAKLKCLNLLVIGVTTYEGIINEGKHSARWSNTSYSRKSSSPLVFLRHFLIEGLSLWSPSFVPPVNK